jgi:glycerophosphoryl diester phosphodiesterase
VSSAQHPLIIAHRGASHDAPENTLASVNLAWEKGARAAEIDVHLSADGQVVVVHDFNTKKLYGRDREVKDQTLAELRELDAGRHKGKKWAGEPIPLLDEVLATVPKGRILVVEIKVGPEIIPELAKSYARSGLGPDQIVMISFNWDSAEEAKKAFPDYRVYALSSFKKDKQTGEWTPTVENLIERALAIGVDGLNVKAIDAVDVSFIAKVKSAGLEAYVYTVNDAEKAGQLKRAGIDGITTDRPRWLAKKLKRY